MSKVCIHTRNTAERMTHNQQHRAEHGWNTAFFMISEYYAAALFYKNTRNSLHTREYN